MINSRPIPVTFPLHTDGSATTPTARLDRARAHTRALSNSLRSATTTAMSGVGPKNSGYSSLANGSTSTMQPLRTEDAQAVMRPAAASPDRQAPIQPSQAVRKTKTPSEASNAQSRV
ncbi:hypothetical protein E4T47_06727 [Aureobasidium subglaciale]|nr:hypothetical protein E4T47_06727 [Aureobasidium subglaciale]